MTLVVTHTEGFLGCFTQNPDGSMRQRALIDVGDEQHSPAQLAELGTTLASEFGWQLNGSLPAANQPAPVALPREPDSIKELKQAQKHRNSQQKKKPAAQKSEKEKRAYIKRARPPMDERGPLLLAYLKEHPGSSIREFAESRGDPWNSATNVFWYQELGKLMVAGLVTRESSSRTGHGGNHHRYSLT